VRGPPHRDVIGHYRTLEPQAQPAGPSRGGEVAVPLGKDACALISRYLAQERPNAGIAEPLGKAHGIPNLHPHALRHACAVELLKRTNDLVAVQQHLRHEGDLIPPTKSRSSNHQENRKHAEIEPMGMSILNRNPPGTKTHQLIEPNEVGLVTPAGSARFRLTVPLCAVYRRAA
jgi:hypothetical protein